MLVRAAEAEVGSQVCMSMCEERGSRRRSVEGRWRELSGNGADGRKGYGVLVSGLVTKHSM